MRKLRVLLMCLMVSVAFVACGDDDDDENNGTTNNGTVTDAGDTDQGDAGAACDETQMPTCCDASLQSVDATCNEDTSEWECPSGATELPVGGVCGEQNDAGDTSGDQDGGTDAGA